MTQPAFDLDYLDDCHRLCTANRDSVLTGKVCGCFHCRTIFPPVEIDEWWDDGDDTAVCPRCGIDAILPESVPLGLSDALLDAMHRSYFQQSFG